MKKLITLFLDFIFPPSPIVLKLRNIAYKEIDLSLKKETHHDFATSLFSYKDDFIEQAIWELKFCHNRNSARMFAYFIKKEIEEKNMTDYLLLPVPLHKSKLPKRGYNQIELLCEEIVKKSSIQKLHYSPNILQKIKNTKDQKDTRDKEERVHNLRDAFVLNKPESIKNKNIILIDDILTTGATLLEIKKVLEKGGAKKVVAVTIAH